MARLAAFLAAGALGGAIVVLAGGNVRGYCHLRGSLPDKKCTPGVVSTRDRAVVCAAGFRPPVPGRPSENKVFRDYGIPRSRRARYRVLALIPLRLGGSEQLRNLWPLALARHPGVAEKQQLDLTLRRLACGGRMTIAAADRTVATDWVSAYRSLVPGAARSHP
jgi:hypothetical protein